MNRHLEATSEVEPVTRTKLRNLMVGIMIFSTLLVTAISRIASAQAQDTTAPQLTAFSFTPDSIDTTSGAVTVTVNFTVTDDLSGANFFLIVFRSPSGTRIQRGISQFAPSTNVTGSVAVTFPQFIAPGTWNVSLVQLIDNVGNNRNLSTGDIAALGFPTQLNVASQEDSVAPTLADFSFSPATIATGSGPAAVSVNFTVTDDLSGATLFLVVFRSPSGNITRTGISEFGPTLSASGSVNVNFPQFSETGIWNITLIQMNDAVGNDRNLSTADVAALGFATQLDVVSVQDTSAPTLTEFSFSPSTINIGSGPAAVTVNFTVSDDVSGATLFLIVFRSPSGDIIQRGISEFGASTNVNGSLAVTFPQFSQTGIWNITLIQMIDAVGNDRRMSTADIAALGFQTELNVVGSEVTAVGPASVWVGLKNSDDVGAKFDLLAEVFRNGLPIGSGQLDGVSSGSSGFNNAVLRTISLALSSPVGIGPGDTLGLRLSVRIAVGVPGHRSGTARLWFNDAQANSRFGATLGGVTSDYFLLNGFTLGADAGLGPKKTIDVFVDRAVGGNPFKPFGMWSKTF